MEYRIATPSYDGGYYLTTDDRDNRYCWSPTKVCLVVRFNSGHTSLYGGEDANAVWYHYHGEILYVDTREQYVVLETPGIKVKVRSSVPTATQEVRPGPTHAEHGGTTYDWVSRTITEDIELALAKLLVEHGYVDPKVLEDVDEGVAMLRFMKGRPSDPSGGGIHRSVGEGGLHLVRRGWDSPEPELLMACTQQD